MARADSRVRLFVVLVRNLDHRASRETPPLLDAWLNQGSIVVDAFSADGASRKRHVQFVKGRERRRWRLGGRAAAPACDAERELDEGGWGWG